MLRHRSTLRLDDAGFASIKDVLDNPRIRSHRPTSAWLHYIIKANDKRRFALDETGTRVRAVQGHSVPIDSSQLLRQLALGDFGSLVPAHGLHSTYFVHIPSIMQHGLLPGGRKGERFRRHDDISGLDLERNLPKRGSICCAEMAAMEVRLLRHMSAGKYGLDAVQTLLYADRNLRSSWTAPLSVRVAWTIHGGGMTSSVSRTPFSLTKKVQPELCALARSISRMTSDPDRKPAVGLGKIWQIGRNKNSGYSNNMW